MRINRSSTSSWRTSRRITPENTVEHQLVRELAESYWGLTRARRIEAMLFDAAMETSDLATPFTAQSQNLKKIRRYRVSTERSYYKPPPPRKKIAPTRRKAAP